MICKNYFYALCINKYVELTIGFKIIPSLNAYKNEFTKWRRVPFVDITGQRAL